MGYCEVGCMMCRLLGGKLDDVWVIGRLGGLLGWMMCGLLGGRLDDVCVIGR